MTLTGITSMIGINNLPKIAIETIEKGEKWFRVSSKNRVSFILIWNSCHICLSNVLHYKFV